MSAKILAFSAVVATASAFAPGASFAPSIRSGASSVSMAMDKSAKAPVITVFDHRGCPRGPAEYKGKSAGNQNDEMLVKAQMVTIQGDASLAKSLLQQTLTLQLK
eukprot:CAMPEP_0181318694 /NCGR_PEP_ID=MMETSP1101-20121128/17146_1 /TAXON_ID=46948 /ORGANISM="Rhodomonas abbreviata, Strain Caron Lab Isolate" /LENGTH=104 /DNA_ID=CAMNT_0023426187 /DNA_START=28 /DNA_END=342 /DNA_ORIENTATION=-